MTYIEYNTSKFPFAELYEKLVGIDNLNLIHTSKLNTYTKVFSREKDQSSIFHKIYYDNFETIFNKTYEKFLEECIRPLYNEPIVYQTIPTFRIHLPGNIAVGEFHKDKWYRDVKWHESVQEKNFFLPFTDVYGGNSIWVESEEDKADYSPMQVRYGQCVKWDGVNLTHGNKTNHTIHTRISVDFRIIKLSNYIPSTHGSINTKKQFAIGGYYKLMN